MDTAITSTAYNAQEERFLHCVLGKAYPSKGCSSPFRLRSIHLVDPAGGTNLVSPSDLSSEQRIAISDLADSLTALEKAGLIVGCCCQTKRAREAQMTPAPADVGGWVVINAGSEPVQDNPWTEFSEQFGFLARSEPATEEAEASCASGSSADTTEQNAQMLGDFEFARQLQAAENVREEVPGNTITPEAAREPEAPPTNSQMQIDNPPAKSEPPTEEAEASCASGSSADTAEQNAQILGDFEYACQLQQAEHDREQVTGNIITPAREPEAPPTNSQMQRDNPPAKVAPRGSLDPRDIYHPGFWTTNCFYD